MAAGVLVALFLGVIFLTAGAGDSAAEPHRDHRSDDDRDAPGVWEAGGDQASDGSLVVPVVAGMFAFNPDPIEVPANVPVTFRLTSLDVVHGFEVMGTNANAMAIPGYVSQPP